MIKKSKRKLKVFVEGTVLVIPHFSGIGHYVAALLKEVDSLLYEEEFSHISFEIGVPYRLRHNIGRFGFENFAIRKMYVTDRIANALKKRDITFPLDLFYGKKLYLFPYYSGWRLMFSKSIPFIYDVSFILYPQFSDDDHRIFLTHQTQLSADRSSRIVAISENAKREIAEHFSADETKIDVIYPILDTNKFYRRSADEVATVKARYGIFGDYIVFVGNLEPRKNLVSLLKAYNSIDPKLQNKYSLLLIGAKGWKDEEITELIIGMRRRGIRVIQPIEYVHDNDLPALLTGAAALTYVSIYEGFGIPPTEAMACGTPCISSYNSSLPEAVGEAALTVEAHNVPEIRRAIERILSDKDLRATLVDAGYRQVGKFNSREIAISFLRSLEKGANLR